MSNLRDDVEALFNQYTGNTGLYTIDWWVDKITNDPENYDLITLENRLQYFNFKEGSRGNLGPQGPQGKEGPRGSQGPLGEKGDTGAQGPKV